MSFKKNIFANYISQIYVAAIGILVFPLYIKYMGAEAYGLIGFFTMLQVWFGLLDLGLTPTIGRETARYHGGAMTALEYRQLFRALSLIFVTMTIIGAGGLWLNSGLIAVHWLNASEIPANEVALSIEIMSVGVALRWMGGLYRGVITGSERLLWLSGFNALMATLRFMVVFLSMYIFGFTPLVFFIHQLIVTLIEFVILFLKNQSILPRNIGPGAKIGWSFKPIKPMIKFSLTIAFTSSVWVFATQTDKLILSGILSLTEYGYFTLAVLVASGILIISGPISNVIMPRMARLHTEGKHVEMMGIYRNATQLVMLITGPAVVTILFCAEPLLYVWTGNREIAEKAAPILGLYAIGNGFLAATSFPYYLQYAYGNLRYHLIGNLMLVITLLPAIIFAANHYRGIGAGYVWLAVNGIYLLTWVAYIHHKLAPGFHMKWLGKDVMFIVVPAIIISYFLAQINFDLGNKMQGICYLLLFSAVNFGITYFFFRYCRNKFLA